MNELDIIRSTSRPNTVDSMKLELAGLGLEKGDLVLVHTRMSSVGWIVGGAQAVIIALMETVGKEGTVAMPSHSGNWSDPSEWMSPSVPGFWIPIILKHLPAFDIYMTPTTRVGKVAESFRTFPGVIRSDHPQTSFAVWGRLASELTRDHRLTRQMDIDSPLGRMYQRNAKVLFLGTGYHTCTCFHLAETMLKDMSTRRMGTALLVDGRRTWKVFKDYDYESGDFNELGEALEREIPSRQGLVGNAECRVFDMKEAVDFATSWLGQHRTKGQLPVK
jgi:aminoglycoside 3-N-acetyltransferase